MKLHSEYESSYDGDEWEQEDFLEGFNGLFEKVFPNGDIAMVAKNHGWRKLNGHRTPEFFANGTNALAKVVGNTDASIRIYTATNGEYGRHIAINTAHHDSPVWDEWTYLVRPARFKELA